MNNKNVHTFYGSKFSIKDNGFCKVCRSEGYNFSFDKRTGFFVRWGKKKEDDPQFSPIGPEILDLEITVNSCSMNCPHCYKSNTNGDPINMNFDQFKNIFDKMPSTLTQIAFGITDIQANPDFIKMMQYSKDNGVIPNFTMTGIDLTDDLADQVSKLCGAIAVSAYEGKKDLCYDTVEKLTARQMDQVNIHLMVSKETLDFCYEVLNDVQTDKRLSNLKAVVFLGLKPKGRAEKNFNPLSVVEFQQLFEFCLENDLSIGFDSCSAPKFENVVKNTDLIKDSDRQRMIQVSESCESTLFSSYINVYGDFFPCSFTEGEGEWEKGISVIRCSNFLSDVWMNPRVEKWRKSLLDSCIEGCRHCITFPEIN